MRANRCCKLMGIPLVALFMSLVFLPGGESQMGSRLFLFNTLVDLLQGDIWESITQKEVSRYLYVYPEDFCVLGIGTTSRPYGMGEIMVWGTVRENTFFWANPEYPYQVSEVHDEDFPWIQVAVLDPSRELSLTMKRTKDLHEGVLERMRRDGIRICAMVIEAVTSRVGYSLTKWIPKSGMDMFGRQANNPYFQAFKEEASARWVFFGFYVDETMAQSCGMVRGQPLILMGYDLDSRNGGLVQFAEIERGTVRYYPIDTHQVLRSDLRVTDVRVHEDRVSIEIHNDGDLTAQHVKVRLTLPDSKREMDAVFPLLKPQDEKTVRFRLDRSLPDKEVLVAIDPDNEIFESDEENNHYEKKRPFWGW
jgi:hypothetical protein